MKKPVTILQKLALYISAVVLVGGFPMMAFAESSDDTTSDDAPSEEDGGYVYDPVTGRWSSNKWRYDAATNTYVPNTPPPAAPAADDSDTATATDTGPNSNNESTDNTQGKTQNNTTNAAQIDNKVSGSASSGNAAVASNNTAGSAGSGNAASVATILNNLNSSSALGGNTYTFTKDIYGDVHGDIVLAPELLKGMAAATSSQNNNQSVDYNVVNKNNVNNDVAVNAASGDASVLNNTKAGDATSGNADAIANVLNIVNSVISANRSFVGTINIHGSLHGDILLSKDGSPSLVSSNASNQLSPGNMIVNQNNLTNILNNVNLDATSGAASTDGNTNAGDAKTGTAKTNLVVMDLAGYNVVAKNSLLVFVNVLGKWVGIIVDAPTGATAAVLGDDVTQKLIAAQGNAAVNADTETNITNNITVGAHTGDATVSGNTNAGNATSGNATASANILNMANSAFSVSDWFGLIFINVLDSWYGSFGVDTPQGDEAATASPPTAGQSAADGSVAAQVFAFVPHVLQTSTPPPASSTDTTSPGAAAQSETSVLSASDTHASVRNEATTPASGPAKVSALTAAAILAGTALLIILVVRGIGALRARFTHVA